MRNSHTTISQRTATTLVLVAALLLTLLVAAQPAHAGSNAVDAENQFATLINHARKARGLKPLAFEDGLRKPSRTWSSKMISDGKLSHDPNLARRVGSDWRRVGENVGVGPSVRSLHDAFMNSSGHRANILGDYNTVGIGVVFEGSRIWVTVTFVKRSQTFLSSTLYMFDDIANNIHRANIERLANSGITKGCGGNSFCPDRALTRAEMASFLVRAKKYPTSAENFRDVPSTHIHARTIGGLAKAGITKGCGYRIYCPNRELTRAEMASFLVRVLKLPPARENFRDVPSNHIHANNIGALAASGITKGCGDGNFCPDRALTRAEMASFLVRAFGL